MDRSVRNLRLIEEFDKFLPFWENRAVCEKFLFDAVSYKLISFLSLTSKNFARTIEKLIILFYSREFHWNFKMSHILSSHFAQEKSIGNICDPNRLTNTQCINDLKYFFSSDSPEYQYVIVYVIGNARM
jgi:hypothetical protein